MALPATDNFNRGSLGANWTLRLNTISISASTVWTGAATVDNLASWNADSFTNDQTSKATVSNLLASVRYTGVCVRLAAAQGYVLYTDGSSGATHTELASWNGAAFTVITNFATTFTTGDELRLDYVGNNWTAYKNGASIGTGSNATFPTGGAPGIHSFDAGNGDNWTGDNIPNTVTNPIIIPSMGRCVYILP